MNTSEKEYIITFLNDYLKDFEERLSEMENDIKILKDLICDMDDGK